MRRDDLYLADILEAADHVANFISGLDFERFLGSELIRSAVVQKLAIIGEAAARISGGLRERHPQIPWAQIAAFRNILIHAYFGVDWIEVWKSARADCPALRLQVADILTQDFNGTAEEGGA